MEDQTEEMLSEKVPLTVANNSTISFNLTLKAGKRKTGQGDKGHRGGGGGGAWRVRCGRSGKSGRESKRWGIWHVLGKVSWARTNAQMTTPQCFQLSCPVLVKSNHPAPSTFFHSRKLSLAKLSLHIYQAIAWKNLQIFRLSVMVNDIWIFQQTLLATQHK